MNGNLAYLWSLPNPSRLFYERYKHCVVRITIETNNGDIRTGTGFHIGEGLIATARHVIENNTIQEIVGDYPQNARRRESQTVCSHNENHQIKWSKIYTSSAGDCDIAILATDYEPFQYRNTVITGSDYIPIPASYIPIGDHFDDWIGDQFLLTRILIIGYPPIPRSLNPYVFTASGEVNAIIDRYDARHVHFVVSPQPRGGLSGAPVISEFDFLLGIVVDALAFNGETYETPATSVISIEPLIGLLAEHHLRTPAIEYYLSPDELPVDHRR